MPASYGYKNLINNLIFISYENFKINFTGFISSNYI